MREHDIIVIGGGAAGFFTAINAAEMDPEARITILERGKEVLTKVRISGGGRCNLTHAEFLPQELIKNYPRGKKELRGPFHSFMTGDVIQWFEKRGVALKTEEDGRVFPVSNSSQSIIDCLLAETDRLGIQVLRKTPVHRFFHAGEKWQIETKETTFTSEKVVLATGSNLKIWNLLQNLGHSIIPAVPSLFTFNIKDKRIGDLPGIAIDVSIKLLGSKLRSEGPLLITHWGMSGPAILKLSAWGARELSEMEEFKIQVNWLYDLSAEEVISRLKDLKIKYAKQQVDKYAQLDLPKRLWQNLVKASGIPEGEKWANLNKKQLSRLASQLTEATFEVHGKSTFKEEFVTAGGVHLKEVDFTTFESKLIKNLFFAGEILNIDAITGGFNFQNAWTGGFIAAKAVAGKKE